jgi:Tfp pilus assembly protein PilF
MAVLIEAINVVVQLETLRQRYPGGIEAYQDACPNRSFCADDHLARIGFLQPSEMESFAGKLEELGLIAIKDGACADFAIVDQVQGPIAPCDWFEWGRHADGFNLCWLAGTKPGTVVVPQGWTLEDSLNIDAIVSRDESRDRDGLEFVREGDELDVYRDPEMGQEVYMTKTATPPARLAGPSAPHQVLAPGAASLSEVDALVQRTLEVEAAIFQARAAEDLSAGETLLAELTNELLPRAERLLDTAENKAAAHYAHGVVLRVCGMFDDAIKAYQRSLDLEPESVPALMEMTVCLGEANRPNDAEPFAQRAVELDSRSAAAWGNLAMVQIQLGDRTRARVALDQALRFDPSDEKNREIDQRFEEFFP